jgi:transcriptional regulator with XRE-family HTH domain
MRRKKEPLSPEDLKVTDQVGAHIKLARKRRNIKAQDVAFRAGINRATLYEIEKGNPGVSMGAYFQVLKVFQLQDNFLKLAGDDEVGRNLQDIQLMMGGSGMKYRFW